jgi:general secretion pathway protein B
MSYILDALKKSDQLRQRGMAPTLLTAQTMFLDYRQQPPPIYALVATVLVGAAMALGWLHSWHAEPGAPDTEVLAIAPIRPPSAPARLPSAPQALAKMESSPPAANPTLRAPSPAPVGEIRKTPPPASVKARTTVASKPPALRPREKMEPPVLDSGIAEETSPGTGVLTMSELPAAVRQEIPKMAVSGYVYSADQQGRMVGINDQLLREGDFLAPGMRLEQILPDGLVFTFKKYRFRHEAQ